MIFLPLRSQGNVCSSWMTFLYYERMTMLMPHGVIIIIYDKSTNIEIKLGKILDSKMIYVVITVIL